jgi:hypothetical protein
MVNVKKVAVNSFNSHTAKECRVYVRFSEAEMSPKGNFEMSLVGVRLVVGRE